MRQTRRNEKILIAEDSISIVVLIKSVLEEKGYEVLCASTGEKAIELAELNCPDLILLDIKMPGIDGFKTCEAMKKEEATQAIPIIFITALDKTFYKVKAFECGAVDYITKPIDTQELLSRVQTHLTIKRLRDELEDSNRHLEERVFLRTAQLKKTNRELKREIVERKQAQAELAKARDELEKKVADRTAELILAKETAETANRSKDAFLANMAHEIRTPVSGITGFTYLMMKSGLSEKHREQMNYIKLSCDHLLSVINDILDLSKIEVGQLQLDNTKFNLSTVVELVIATLTPKSQEKKLALSCHIEPNVPQKLIGDPTRLRQVLFNLIYNAIKFTGTGEVRLRCRVQEQTPKETTLQFSVTDTGIGLPREQFDRIFQRFAQANMYTQTNHGGTGLGLSISKHLVELMGGEIWVESKPGSGSSFNFTVKLPVHYGSLRAVEAPDQSGSMGIAEAAPSDIQKTKIGEPKAIVIEDMENTALGNCALSILLVEDDLINRKMAANMLKKMGACVTTADNGADALKKMEKCQFDIVFMDVQMPVMDGIEATRRIRERDTGGDYPIPVIAITAHAMQGDSEKFLKAGMSDYISKPIDPDTLMAKLWIWHHNIQKKGKGLQTVHRLAARRYN
jgi:signal transduction histidine kinase